MATGAIITTLVENTVNIQGLRAEHGLSFLIRIGGNKVVFDTGASDLVLENARRMGLELADVDAVVLSHGHYDHTGGVEAVLGIAPQAEIHVHSDALAPKYTRQADGTSRYIGMPPAVLKALAKAESRVCRSPQPREIRPGLFLTGTIPRVTDFEDTGGRFFLDAEGKNPDLLTDEQSLYLDMPQGLVVLLGCGHPGVINTLLHIRKLTNERPVHSVVGGMHLLSAGPERLTRTLEELRALQIQRIVPMHCTGAWPSARLRNAFEKRCAMGPVGTSIAI
jgi:7,8-dihydropterin-6-yl-methyl-4-(beta-D-ribofuranosyl)aminobenzene 5'-phosphate synthase